MTFLSLADTCRCLGIDSKTLHRWLAEAQLPLQSHPRDGRKKGVSKEHLELLARLHQRCLTSSSEQPPLLTLTEMLSTLHVQIAVLQQQVAELTQLFQQRTPPPALPEAPAQPTTPAKRTAKPRTRPAAAAKTPPKPRHVIPHVEYGHQGRYVVICPKRGLLPFEPDTPEWFAWVAKQASFRFVGRSGHFTAHHEWRVPRGAWRAHRQIRNHNYVVRLASNHELTLAVLEQAAEALQALLTTP